MSLVPVRPTHAVLLLLENIMDVIIFMRVLRFDHAIGSQFLKGPGQLRHRKRPWELVLASA